MSSKTPLMWEAKKGWFVDILGSIYGPYKNEKEALVVLEEFYSYQESHKCKNCEDT